MKITLDFIDFVRGLFVFETYFLETKISLLVVVQKIFADGGATMSQRPRVAETDPTKHNPPPQNKMIEATGLEQEHCENKICKENVEKFRCLPNGIHFRPVLGAVGQRVVCQTMTVSYR